MLGVPHSWPWRKRSSGSTCRPPRTLRGSSRQRYVHTGTHAHTHRLVTVTDSCVCVLQLNELADRNAECVEMLHESQEEIRELRNKSTPSAGLRRHLSYGLYPMVRG